MVLHKNNNGESILYNRVFRNFLKEIQSLGFIVSDEECHGFLPYGIVRGRSNQRWWLVPLKNHNITKSGFDLFQPISTSAKLFKKICVFANRLGGDFLWGRNKVYISKDSALQAFFGNTNLSYSFFTGTDSPHRKTTIQIMDHAGTILGFAKVAKDTNVKKLLIQEAETLERLKSFKLHSIVSPSVLHLIDHHDVKVLITDTRKTKKYKVITTLNDHHYSLFSELTQKTVVQNKENTDWFITEMICSYKELEHIIPEIWRYRLENAIEYMCERRGIFGQRLLSHGDFTPWNTFFSDEKLHVFDWEYAGEGYPIGYDLIHFIYSFNEVKRIPISETIEELIFSLSKANFVESREDGNILLLSYFVKKTLFYVERQLNVSSKADLWDGEQLSAVFLDNILEATIK